MRRPLLAALVLGSIFPGCASQPPGPASQPSASTSTEITVFALSDFHGWLAPRTLKSSPRFYGGIAHIAASMQGQSDADGAILIDNGDMWTGPTESTFLRGQPVIEAYNLIGVSAANVANHEFDFGRPVLEARAKEARFPFLGANIVDKSSGTSPWFVQPWVIVERRGVEVGIVGLSFVGTPQTTLARHVQDLEFQDYAQTLRREVPRLREAGADVIAVLLHDTPAVGRELVQAVGTELGLDLVVAGQDHRKSSEVVDGIPVVNPGPFGTSYAKFVVTVEGDAVRSVVPSIVDVAGSLEAPPYPTSPELVAVVESARGRAKELSDEVLGSVARPLPVGSFEASPLGHLIVDSWLGALGEEVDFAILNHGAIRQPMASGPVTLADLTGVMPFENNLMVVELSGEQLASQLAIDHPIVGGMTWEYRTDGTTRTVTRMLDRAGKEVEADGRYRVAVIDFMYGGGDGYQFETLDPNPVDTGLSWRDPVVRALREAEASARAMDPHTQPRAQRE